MEKINTIINKIATSINVATEDVEAVMYGEIPISDPQHYKPIMQEIVKDGRGIFLFVIWDGKVIPHAQQNNPLYDYIGQIIEGMNLALQETRYMSQILITTPEIADQAYFERILTYRGNAALVNLAHYTEDLQTTCDNLARPSVYLDYPHGENPDGRYIISIRGKKAMLDLFGHLFFMGHRRIGFIKGPQALQSDVDRYQGYLDGLQAFKLPYDEALVRQGNWLEDSGQLAAEYFLSLDPPPTAIMASNDRMALGVIQALQDRGIRVPEDISVTGFDDEAHATLYEPHITTVSVHVQNIGRIVANYAVKLLEGYAPEPSHYYMPLEIVKRASSGIVRKQ